MGARATKDIDTLFRGDFERFIERLDEALAEPFAGIAFRRTEPVKIEVPGKAHSPIRLDVILSLSGRTWRRISLDVAPDEGRAGSRIERFKVPSLAHFGLPTPETAAGIPLAYQVAQKLHACSAPHSEAQPNYRVRDIVDLLLLKHAYFADTAGIHALSEACYDVFATRSQHPSMSTARSWPPTIIAHPHWRIDYPNLANEVELGLSLDEAITEINDWISVIDRKL